MQKKYIQPQLVIVLTTKDVICASGYQGVVTDHFDDDWRISGGGIE